MDRFESMSTFIRVVEIGSISGTAEKVGVAKSVVSRRLKELEEFLGVELFHRTTRRMNLTDTGRAYYDRCVRILEDVTEAELATSQQHGELQGSLKVAMPLSFGLMHLGPAINEFLAAHPQIEFDLDFNDRNVDIMQEGFDLAIRIGKLQDSSLIARRLAAIEMMLCASPAYLERMGIPKSPEDLMNHQCLVYTLQTDIEDWQFLGTNNEIKNIKIPAILKSNNGEQLRDAALADLGVVLQPSFIVYKEIERGDLIPLLTEYRKPTLNTYAIYPQTRHLSQRVRAFVDFLAKRFDGVPYWDACF